MINWGERLKDLNEHIDRITVEHNLSKKDVYLSAIWNHLRHGASIRDFLVGRYYLKSNASMKTFTTYRRWKKVENYLNDRNNAEIVVDKKRFNTLMKRFVKREWIFTGDCTGEEIIDFIKKQRKVICKPVNAGMGEGVFAIYEGEEVDDKTVKLLTEEDYMVEEFIVQHDVLNRFNESSVNTLRVMTLRHKNEDIGVTSCTLKVGAEGDVTDNLSAGGTTYPLDASRGIIIGEGSDFDGNRFKTEFIGLKIPNWEAVLYTVKSAAELITDQNYLSWDVAITPDGCEIIEANVDSGYRHSDMDGIGKFRYLLKNGKKYDK